MLLMPRSTALSEYLASLEDVSKAEIGLLVNLLIQDAVDASASDVHIEPWGDGLAVRFRVAGKLHVADQMPASLADKISGRLRVMASLTSFEKGVPQDGRISLGQDMGGVSLRLSIFPLYEGEKIVMRIFDPRRRTFDLNKLGLDPRTRDHFKSLLMRTSGLILLNGPTGSGKTTMIYSALGYLLKKHGSGISISTVEDPVEAPLAMVSQSQLDANRSFTYPVALRSLLRQDPQVIMIGEIRDADTAAIAVQASLTGHLVISTIHSGTTAGVFTRLFNMGIEPFLLCSSIVGIMGLRLVRINCKYCAAPYEPDPHLIKDLPAEVLNDAQFRKGQGCDKCDGTGFGDRAALTELLIPNDPLREAVLAKRPSRELMQIAMDADMETLYEQGLYWFLNGHTTIEEVLSVVADEI